MTLLDSYEAVRRGADRREDDATLARLERSCLPTIGACTGQFTANIMAMAGRLFEKDAHAGRLRTELHKIDGIW